MIKVLLLAALVSVTWGRNYPPYKIIDESDYGLVDDETPSRHQEPIVQTKYDEDDDHDLVVEEYPKSQNGYGLKPMVYEERSIPQDSRAGVRQGTYKGSDINEHIQNGDIVVGKQGTLSPTYGYRVEPLSKQSVVGADRSIKLPPKRKTDGYGYRNPKSSILSIDDRSHRGHGYDRSNERSSTPINQHDISDDIETHKSYIPAHVNTLGKVGGAKIVETGLRPGAYGIEGGYMGYGNYKAVMLGGVDYAGVTYAGPADSIPDDSYKSGRDHQRGGSKTGIYQGGRIQGIDKGIGYGGIKGGSAYGEAQNGIGSYRGHSSDSGYHASPSSDVPNVANVGYSGVKGGSKLPSYGSGNSGYHGVKGIGAQIQESGYGHVQGSGNSHESPNLGYGSGKVGSSQGVKGGRRSQPVGSGISGSGHYSGKQAGHIGSQSYGSGADSLNQGGKVSGYSGVKVGVGAKTINTISGGSGYHGAGGIGGSAQSGRNHGIKSVGVSGAGPHVASSFHDSSENRKLGQGSPNYDAGYGQPGLVSSGLLKPQGAVESVYHGFSNDLGNRGPHSNAASVHHGSAAKHIPSANLGIHGNTGYHGNVESPVLGGARYYQNGIGSKYNNEGAGQLLGSGGASNAGYTLSGSHAPRNHQSTVGSSYGGAPSSSYSENLRPQNEHSSSSRSNSGYRSAPAASYSSGIGRLGQNQRVSDTGNHGASSHSHSPVGGHSGVSSYQPINSLSGGSSPYHGSSSSRILGHHDNARPVTTTSGSYGTGNSNYGSAPTITSGNHLSGGPSSVYNGVRNSIGPSIEGVSDVGSHTRPILGTGGRAYGHGGISSGSLGSGHGGSLQGGQYGSIPRSSHHQDSVGSGNNIGSRSYQGLGEITSNSLPSYSGNSGADLRGGIGAQTHPVHRSPITNSGSSVNFGSSGPSAGHTGGSYAPSAIGSAGYGPSVHDSRSYSPSIAGPSAYAPPSAAGATVHSPFVTGSRSHGPSIAVGSHSPSAVGSSAYGPSILGSGHYEPTVAGSSVHAPSTAVGSRAYGPAAVGTGTHGASSAGSGAYGPSSVGSAVYGSSGARSGVYRPVSVGSGTYGPSLAGSGTYGPSSAGTGAHGPSLAGSGAHGPSSAGYGAHRPSSVGAAVHGPSSDGSDAYGSSPAGSSISALLGEHANARVGHGSGGYGFRPRNNNNDHGSVNDGYDGGDDNHNSEPKPYSFEYVAPDDKTNAEHFRKESGDGLGNVQGSYGYRNEHGIYRHVDYEVTKEGGFRANVKTNEPGTENEDPADVHFEVDKQTQPQY